KTLINLLRGSDTLAQLARRRIEQKVLNIDQSSFRQHFTRFKERVYQVPLNTETRETIEQVILVGIEKILSEKEQIIEHVQKNYGQLYLLHEKLPLHTDHVPQTSAGSFGTVLDDLLINFFAAFIIADSKGLLHIFL
ncbi:MAG: hypothetical protein LRY69_07180, partial [Gammaproteobacteria bacterium]|nr:hypothetical protein [Gammaproteobacteria bacterium]